MNENCSINASPPTVRRSSRRSSRSSRSSSGDPVDFLSNGCYDESLNTPPVSLPPSHSPSPDSLNGPLMYGGLTAMTWHEFRKDIKNFTKPYYLASEIPHAMQDTMNYIFSSHARSLPAVRHCFESAIQQNTADDEPDAPRIEIFNHVDSDPTPPWEFHYSNKMWHSEGVPPPDITRLTSCDCEGKCDPKSKTCACIKRQRQWTSEWADDFVYDSRGRLKLEHLPIFECNDLCQCDDECRNRVCL